MQALEALRRPISQWDNLMVHILSIKLDARSMHEWQGSLTNDELPTIKQFLEFVTHRCDTLEASGRLNLGSSKEANMNGQSKLKSRAAYVAAVKEKCNHCRGKHSIYYCERFLALTVPQRIAAIRKGKICVNCLRSIMHNSAKCTSGTCRICKQKHNTLLHFKNSDSDQQGDEEKPDKETSRIISFAASAAQCGDLFSGKNVLLSTASVLVVDAGGSTRTCRVLLDCGSQANFVTRRFVAALGIKTISSTISISGIGNTITKANQVATIQLQSRIGTFSTVINCIVTEQVTDRLPAFTMRRNAFDIPRNIKLADPQFHVSSDIDILVGAELFWQLICVGRISPFLRHLTLQKTHFGWILAGYFKQPSGNTNRVQTFHLSVTNEQLHNELRQLWQLEEVKSENNYSRDKAVCEQHFVDNIKRNAQGRFIVTLPFKEGKVDKIGDSRDIALKRLHGLEKRLSRDPELRAQYAQFMDKYLELRHMTPIKDASRARTDSYYFPHHCIVKSAEFKFRAVFDAFSKSDTGVSLNDTLLIGPVVQQDLMMILMRFRMFLYVITADIIKMCLKYLADAYQEKYPIGSVRVKRDFYVDDLLTGADTIFETKTAHDEIIAILQLGALKLRKWASNHPELLKSLNDASEKIVTINDGADFSVLGVQWNQEKDFLHFLYKPDETHRVTSKRAIMSEAFKIFDPLGLLGPIMVLAKLIIQEL
ncbi:uncharacterized protein LOC112588808 [Harpegnathos saltator]|uniref:uncharacterized protein LOC112588808 n=1 Tax=Harpegnathos saltator TaxID=610380 RepID=UPI000DBEE5D2|nr:uncharacterized protein LOC112588808 [Harpegnathos saltator]